MLAECVLEMELCDNNELIAGDDDNVETGREGQGTTSSFLGNMPRMSQ